MKSRAVWISSGDKNNIFFQKYTSFIRKTNTIWEIEYGLGVKDSKIRDIDMMEIDYIGDFFKAKDGVNFDNQLTYPSLCP